MFSWNTYSLCPASFYIYHCCWTGKSSRDAILWGTFSKQPLSFWNIHATEGNRWRNLNLKTSTHSIAISLPKAQLRHHRWKPCGSQEGGCQVGCAPAETCNRADYPGWPPVNEASKEEPIVLPQDIPPVLESDQPRDRGASICPQSRELRELNQKIHASLVSSKDFPMGSHCLSRERKLKAFNFLQMLECWQIMQEVIPSGNPFIH